MTWLYPREPLPAMIWGNLAASPMNGSLTFTITIPTSGSWPIRWRGIGHIAANHSTWDLELDNITVESLVLIYADFRVKQMRDESGKEITKIYSLKDSYDVILSKLDNVDEAKRNRYRAVYSRLYEFERYMRSLGADTELSGNPPKPEKRPDIAIQNSSQIVTSFLYFAIEHNIDVMHRLGSERQFGNILEAARSEKDWKNVRAYLNIFNEYSIHLDHKQKEQTISFLYELLLNREGDIRRQAAALIGKMFANFNAGYRKEIPADMADLDDRQARTLWEAYMEKLICPDYRLTLQQKRRIQNSLKYVLLSGIEHSDDQVREEMLTIFYRWFDGSHELDEDARFALLDAVFSMPAELCARSGRLDCLAEFAVDNMDHEDDRVRVAAVRALKVLTSVVTRENACYERVRKAVTEMDTGSITMVFLQYRILTNLRAGYRVPAGDPVRQRRGQRHFPGESEVCDALDLKGHKYQSCWPTRWTMEDGSTSSISAPICPTSSRSASMWACAMMRERHCCGWAICCPQTRPMRSPWSF